MAATLRPYQVKAINDLFQSIRNGNKRIVLCMPTGAGKTTTAGALIHKCLQGNKKILTFMHRKELVRQFTTRLYTQFDVNSGIIMAGIKPNYNWRSQIGSIQSMIRRQLPDADLVIVDEGHRIRAKTYEKVLDQYPNAIVVILTATPFRLDGKSLGSYCTDIVHPVTVKELIDMNYLVPTEIYKPVPGKSVTSAGVKKRMGEFTEKDQYEKFHDVKIYEGAVENYLKNGNDQQMFCFNINVKHSIETNKYFLDAGISSAHLDGETPKHIRDEIFKKFSRGEIKVLHNVGLFVEGIDVPACGGVILNRLINSLGFYVQAVGRCMRPFPGKTHGIVLDQADNWKRLGYVDDYDDMGFDLEVGDKKTASEKGQKTVNRAKACPECDTINDIRAMNCKNDDCEFTWEVEEEDIIYGDAQDFIKLDRVGSVLERIGNWQYRDLEKLPLHYLRIYGILKGYNWQWAFHEAARRIPNVDSFNDMTHGDIKFALEIAERQYHTEGFITQARKRQGEFAREKQTGYGQYQVNFQ